jgi:hypothetical protein
MRPTIGAVTGQPEPMQPLAGRRLPGVPLWTLRQQGGRRKADDTPKEATFTRSLIRRCRTHTLSIC